MEKYFYGFLFFDAFNLCEGPEIKILCQDAIETENGTLIGTMITRDPWPICTQPPCTCVGAKDLSVEKHRQILRFSCNNTYNEYVDINGNAFIAPNRISCGTYKLSAPSFESRCICDDIMERKLTIYIEISSKV